MTLDPHPDMDELILFCMGSPGGASNAQEDTAIIDRVRAHLQQCAECSAQAAQLRTDMALITMSAPQTAPPPEAKERLFLAAGLNLAGNTGKSASIKPFPMPVRDASASLNTPPIRPRHTNRGLLWGGWVAAVLCLFYAIHIRELNQGMQHRLAIETAELNQSNAAASRARDVLEVLTSPQAQRVTLVSAHAQPEPTGEAVYLKERGALVFTANNLVPLPANKTYELWVIPASGAAPIPAGTFQPDAHGMASVLLPHLPSGIQAKAFGVTMENAGGSATPTLPILLAGSSG